MKKEERESRAEMSTATSGCVIASDDPAPSPVPVAVWSGTFRLFGVDVHCHRLSDGQNIIEEESMHRLLGAMASGTTDIGDLEVFARFQSGQSVQSNSGDKP